MLLMLMGLLTWDSPVTPPSESHLYKTLWPLSIGLLLDQYCKAWIPKLIYGGVSWPCVSTDHVIGFTEVDARDRSECESWVCCD
jgi:hypothetical protein